MTHARVIGAGLSGLTAAWFLSRQGASVQVFEAADRPGGLIQSFVLPAGLVEAGANAFVWTPAIATLFSELGIEPLFARDASRRRYIYRDGRPRRWPLTPTESAASLGRFASAWIRRSTTARPGETVSAWGDRVLGRAATTWLLAPALQGIYGAAPEDLSARVLGNARRRGRVRLAAPKDGMGALTERLTRRLMGNGVTFSFGCAVDALDPVVPTLVCTSAAAAAPLLRPHHPHMARAVSRIRSAPLVTATAFFEPRPDDLQGFGVLFPRSTARALGVLFDAEVFAHRSAMRSERWIYGDASLVSAPTEETLAAVLKDRALLASSRQPPTAFHVRAWPSALPVYDDAILKAVEALASLPAWLGVCGNYLGRIGVSALVERAEQQARRIVGNCDQRTKSIGPA